MFSLEVPFIIFLLKICCNKKMFRKYSFLQEYFLSLNKPDLIMTYEFSCYKVY